MTFKVVFVGEEGVGKTSIIKRLCSSSFNSREGKTRSADYSTYNFRHGSCLISLNLWDTFGYEGPKRISPQYLKEAKAVTIVYDVTKRRSFESVKNRWLPWLKKKIDKKCEILIIGNKLDLLDENKREVSEYEGYNQLSRHQDFFF